MATSVPVPMAMPRSAWASAAASLTPSPTMATTRPWSCSRRTTSTLSAGQHLGDHLADADLGGDGAGGARVVPGQQHRAQPQPGELRDRLGAGGFDGVGDDQDAAHGAVPADRDRGPPGGLGFGAGGVEPVVEPLRPLLGQPGRRGRRRRRDRRRRRARPGPGWRRSPAPAAGRRAGRGRRRRSRRRSGARRRPRPRRPARSSSLLVGALGGHDIDQCHLPGGDGAGLVQHDRVDPAGGLQDLRALDQDAQLRAAAGADQQRGRRGQPERARAGDDQHRDRGGERHLRAGTGRQPVRRAWPARAR